MKNIKIVICLVAILLLSNIIVFAGYNIENVNLKKEYKEIRKYSNGLAVVQANYAYGEKYGAIDKYGNEILPCEYEYMSDFSEGYAIIQKQVYYSKKWGTVDTKGNERFWNEDFDEIIGLVHEGKILVKKYDRYTYVDLSGKRLSDYQYFNTEKFSDSLALIKNDGVIGYIDENTKVVIPMEYYDGKSFSEGLAPVKTQLTWQYIDKNNNVVIKGMYFEDATEFSEGIAAISKQEMLGKRYALINKSGNTLTNFIFEDVGKLSDGLIPIKQYDMWGFADSNGNIVIKPKYTKVSNFSGGYATVCLNNNYGVIDTNGNEIIGLKYHEATDVENGVVALKYYNKWNIFRISKNETARITKQKIYINGNETNFETYNILDNNYVKLRDVVYAIGKYNLKYNVVWNESKQRIDIVSNKQYIQEGNEMKILNKGKAEKNAIKNSSIVFKDEISQNILAYTIDGYNYMKLRDLGNMLNFKVEYNEGNNSVNITIK